MLHIVCDLATACTCTGLNHDVLEARNTVLKQLDLTCAGCGWPSTGEFNHIAGLLGLDFILRTDQVLLNHSTYVCQLEHRALAHEAHVGLLPNLLLVLDAGIDRGRDA